MIWLILFLGSLLRLVSLNQSLWLDEAINVQAAKSFSLVGMVMQYAVADFHPPGWFVILWSWGKLFGYSEIVVRLPSVIFGVLTIYITYLIGKKLVSRNLGFLAALLLSVNPLHIYYSQEARMYALATLAVSLNMLLFINLVKGDKDNWGNMGNRMIFIASSLLVLVSDYVAYLIFPAQLIFLLMLKKKEAIKKWMIMLVTAILLSIWWLPIFLGQLNVGLVASSNLPAWKFIQGAFDFKTIPLTFVKFIIGRISLTDKIMYVTALLPIVSLFAYLLWRGQRKLSGFPKNLLIAWVIIPPLFATIISIFIPVYSYFRMLFIIPGFIILIANGILSFKNKLKYGFLVFVVLIQVFCALVYLLNPNYQREDWKGLVNFFRRINPPLVLFESSGILSPFDYYAGGRLNAAGALKDFPAKDQNDVVNLESLLQGSKDIYLVEYLVDISDPQRLVQKKLNELSYKQTDTKNFTGIGFVYHYVKNE